MVVTAAGCYSCCHFYRGCGVAVAKAVSGVAGYLEGCKQRRAVRVSTCVQNTHAIRYVTRYVEARKGAFTADIARAQRVSAFLGGRKALDKT